MAVFDEDGHIAAEAIPIFFEVVLFLFPDCFR
jgi:hypothetical protein